MKKTFSLFDLEFSSRTQKETAQHVQELSRASKASSVILCNAHVVVESEWAKEFKALLKKVTLVIPDGAPIAWLLHAKGQKMAQRYSGVDLMEDIFRNDPEGKHFFLGSSQKVLDQMKERFKGKSVGFYSPPFALKFSDEEEKKQLKLVEDSGAHYIWVGLGAPKQERYVVNMASQAKQGTWLAVGAAFDFYAGLKPRAPKILQKAGMEWAFRFASEPRRLWKRYLTTNPVFIKLALKELLKG